MEDGFKCAAKEAVWAIRQTAVEQPRVWESDPSPDAGQNCPFTQSKVLIDDEMTLVKYPVIVLPKAQL